MSFPKACSDNLKIKPVWRFVEWMLAEDYGVAHGNKRGSYEYTALIGEPIRCLIGITAGEAKRRLKPDDTIPRWMRLTVARTYPLVELGMDRADCQRFIRSLGLDPPYPSLCRRCPYKTPADLAYMARFDAEGLAEWIDLERAKLEAHPRRFPGLPPERNHGVFPGKTLPEVIAKAVREHAGMTDDQMHERRMAGHAVASRH